MTKGIAPVGGLTLGLVLTLLASSAITADADRRIPHGARLADHTDLGCSNATWDEQHAAWRTTLPVAETQVGKEGGFCSWGAIREIADARKGTVYTISWSMMVPAGLRVESATGAGFMKLMRINTRTPADENAGYIDVYEAHRRKDVPNARWGLIKENDEAGWTWIAADEPTRDVFHDYKMRVVLDDVSRSAGGKASIRFWVDGVLVGESKPDTVTLGGPDHVAQNVYFMTYYNGVAPEDQVRFFRDLEVEVDR